MNTIPASPRWPAVVIPLAVAAAAGLAAALIEMLQAPAAALAYGLACLTPLIVTVAAAQAAARAPGLWPAVRQTLARSRVLLLAALILTPAVIVMWLDLLPLLMYNSDGGPQPTHADHLRVMVVYTWPLFNLPGASLLAAVLGAAIGRGVREPERAPARAAAALIGLSLLYALAVLTAMPVLHTPGQPSFVLPGAILLALPFAAAAGLAALVTRQETRSP